MHAYQTALSLWRSLVIVILTYYVAMLLENTTSTFILWIMRLCSVQLCDLTSSWVSQMIGTLLAFTPTDTPPSETNNILIQLLIYTFPPLLDRKSTFSFPLHDPIPLSWTLSHVANRYGDLYLVKYCHNYCTSNKAGQLQQIYNMIIKQSNSCKSLCSCSHGDCR